MKKIILSTLILTAAAYAADIYTIDNKVYLEDMRSKKMLHVKDYDTKTKDCLVKAKEVKQMDNCIRK